MTHEEIALKIKKLPENEKTQYFFQLWERVKGLICRYAGRFYNSNRSTCDRAGVTVEDLTQCGFIGLVGAVNDFQTDKGYLFTAYLKFHLLNEFRAALTGGKRKDTKSPLDPLHYCQSFDITIDGDDGGKLADLIPDNRSYEAFERIVSRDYIESLHETLKNCLDSIDPQRAQAIRRKYYQGETYKTISENMGISINRASQMVKDGIREIRRSKFYNILYPFWSDRGEEYYYYYMNHTGLGIFKQGAGSSVEIAVERMKK